MKCRPQLTSRGGEKGPRTLRTRLLCGLKNQHDNFKPELRQKFSVRRAAEAEAEALREETAVRRDVIEALHRRVEELERELAMRDAFQEA